MGDSTKWFLIGFGTCLVICLLAYALVHMVIAGVFIVIGAVGTLYLSRRFRKRGGGDAPPA